MENTKNVTVLSKKIRLWDKNPRYTEYADIEISNIGREDFTIDSSDEWIECDNYQNKKNDIIYKLLNDYNKAASMHDLIDSLSNGFDNGIDDIIIVKPEWLYPFAEGEWNYLKDEYYVVEGNRRIAAIMLLENLNNERSEILKKVNSDTNLDDKTKGAIINIIKLCDKNDDRHVFLKAIECVVLDYNFYTSKEGIILLNKILNAKHFGNRKGKLNWPRGLMLKKIFRLTKKFLKNNHNNTNNNALYKYIEARTGKKIAATDIGSAVFVSECIDSWNSRNPSQRIILSETELGDLNEAENIIYVDNEGVEISSNDYVKFSISALELAKNKIKLLNRKYEMVSLSKVIKFQSNFSDFDNLGLEFHSVEEKNKYTDDEKTAIIDVICSAILAKKLTTRDADEKVGEEIRRIIYKNNNLNFDDALNLSLKDIEIISTSTDLVLKDNIDKMLYSVKKIINHAEELIKLDLENANVFIETLRYIWKVEYARIFKLKKEIVLKNIPVLIFSTLLRTTVEFIQTNLYKQLIINHLSADESFEKNNEYSKLIKDCFVLSITKKYFPGRFLVDNFNSKINDVNNSDLVIDDFNKIFDILFGIVNIKDNTQMNFKAGIFDLNKIDDKDFFIVGFNGNNLCNNIGIDKTKFQDIIVPKIKENNFFGLLSNGEQVDCLIDILNKVAYDDNENMWNKINRFIHKPSYSMSTYLFQNDFVDILAIIETLEESILKMIS
jgi:hypothetical protein